MCKSACGSLVASCETRSSHAPPHPRRRGCAPARELTPAGKAARRRSAAASAEVSPARLPAHAPARQRAAVEALKVRGLRGSASLDVGSPREESSCPGWTGWTRASIFLRKFSEGWIAGSSPAIDKSVLGGQIERRSCQVAHQRSVSRSRRLKKRTCTLRASAGGEARRVRNGRLSPSFRTGRVGSAVQA